MFRKALLITFPRACPLESALDFYSGQHCQGERKQNFTGGNFRSNFEFRQIYKDKMIDRLASVAGVVPNQVRIRDIDYFHNSGQPL